MSTTSLFREGVTLLRDRGVRATTREAQAFLWEAGVRQYYHRTGQTDRGDPIYEEDWDALIILDACRVDFLREIAHEYAFVDDVDEFESLGSYSRSWMERNFTDNYTTEMAGTVHVTGNPFSDVALDTDAFAHLDEVWRYAWDDDIGTIHPRPITDRAISLARDRDPDCLVVHYMQPHAPFTQHPDLQPSGPNPDDWMSSTDKSVWERVRDGELALDAAQAAYRDELRYVLDDVALLLENLDAETVVITADHGEMMGELFLHGHPRGIAADPLRVVPWVETTATDTGEHEPNTHEMDAEAEVADRLSDLGYL